MSKAKFETVKHRGSLIRVARAHNVWLGVVDIGEHAPIRVTIEKVVEYKNGKFPGGRTKDGQALQFVGKKKLLNVNATNINRLAKIVGVAPQGLEADQLAQLQIVLDIEKLDKVFNGHTHGIRIQVAS